MKHDITFWIGIVLLLFTTGLLWGLPIPEDPNPFLMDLAESSIQREGGGHAPSSADVNQRYHALLMEQWVMWIQNTILLSISVLAGLLAVFRKKFALLAVFGASALMALTYIAPILQSILSGSYFKTINLTISMILRNELEHGVWLIWHAAMAPLAYLLLALVAMFALIKMRPQN